MTNYKLCMEDIISLWYLATNFYCTLNMFELASKIFGSSSSRMIKDLHNTVNNINQIEDELIQLNDKELSSKTQKFKERINNGENFDDILPEAFAVVRESSKRTLNMRHFDVQLMGGIITQKELRKWLSIPWFNSQSMI